MAKNNLISGGVSLCRVCGPKELILHWEASFVKMVLNSHCNNSRVGGVWYEEYNWILWYDVQYSILNTSSTYPNITRIC